MICDVNMTYLCLIVAEMKTRFVSKWFVGHWGIVISGIVQGTSADENTYAVEFSITDLFKLYRK